MKGIVFTEFLEMIESVDGYEVADRVLTETDGITGHYTSVGTYNHMEIVHMVVKYCAIKDIPVNDALEAFGSYLLTSFSKGHPTFFEVSGTFEFLSGINERIHKEVRKLYPDAELPNFIIEKSDSEEMVMVYESSRQMSHLALGLIKQSIVHFDEQIEVDHSLIDEEGKRARFHLKKIHG